MELSHVAVACGSEENADRFYADLLGLRKAEPKRLPVAIGRALFGIERELTIINYLGDSARVEVFICPAAPKTVEHSCLAVDDLGEFLRRCEELGIETIRLPKGETIITFVRDRDGNLFEIKEK